MIGVENFDRVARQYDLCWNLQNHDAPLLQITALKDKAVFKERKISLTEKWTDTEYILETSRERMNNTYFGGAAYPILWPNLGPDLFGAVMGSELEFGSDTVWAVVNRELKLADLSLGSIDRNNRWFQRLISMTEAMLEDAKGDYIVGMTDLHGGMDGLVSLRGPEQLCFDMLEEPELVQKLCMESFQAYKQLYTELNGRILARQTGATNWMGVYHSESWYVSSCDFICMISPEMYREFVEPEVKMEIALYKNSIFHLDGPGALRHLDSLLGIEELRGIQWVYGAGQPSAAHWIEVLRKIQNAGKMVHILAEKSDLPMMKKYLRPEGLIIDTHAKNETEAKEIEQFAADWNK